MAVLHSRRFTNTYVQRDTIDIDYMSKKAPYPNGNQNRLNVMHDEICLLSLGFSLRMNSASSTCSRRLFVTRCQNTRVVSQVFSCDVSVVCLCRVIVWCTVTEMHS